MENVKERNFANIIADFNDLRSIVTGLGSIYNPSRTDICLKELDKTGDQADKLNESMHGSLRSFKDEIIGRETSFLPLNKITTRAINALHVYPITGHLYQDARNLVSLIQGNGKKHNHTTPPANPGNISNENETQANENLTAVPTTPGNYTSHQLSYDMRLENFHKFIILLSDVPVYTPNEDDLKVTSLKTYYDKLYAKNKAVITAANAYSTSKQLCFEFMFDEITGLVVKAAAVKAYVKSLSGPNSQPYKHVSKLRFVKPQL